MGGVLHTVQEWKERLTCPLPKPHFTLVGDVHGEYVSYLDQIADSHCSLQVGDLVGDVAEGVYPTSKLLTMNHRFIGGNHEAYGTVDRPDISIDDPRATDSYSNFFIKEGVVKEFTNLPPNHLGHYGVWEIPDCISDELSGKIFFMRGAWSIDHPHRIMDHDLFEAEELTMAQGYAALELYNSVKPDFVVTHACPQFLQNLMPLPYMDGFSHKTRTGQILDMMFESHKPKLWVYGHYHMNYTNVIDDTVFMCLKRCMPLHFTQNLRLILR